MIIAIDPGKEKCGLAVLDTNGNILERKIVASEKFVSSLPLYLSKYGVSTLVVGKSSFGKALENKIAKLDLSANIIFVSEQHSTLEARRRYWKENKPKGIWRLIPTSLRVPPVPVDDYAAAILGERYLKG